MRRFSQLAIAALWSLLPTAVLAADWLPIVQCGRSDQIPPMPCSPCDLFKAFHNVIDLVLYGVTGPVAAFMIVVAGGMMLLSAGNANMYGNGKKILKNTLIGVSIIFLSWVFTNFLIKSLADGSQYDSWNEFTCPAGLASIVNIETTFPTGPGPAAPNQSAIAQQVAATFCSPANLVALYGTSSNTALNARSLTTLMSCIEQDPIVKALYDSSQRFTYELTRPVCNLTRGDPKCGVCQHSVNSCHYGGKTGNQGAMAVDYNAKTNRVTYVIATRAIVSSASDSRCSPPQSTSGSSAQSTSSGVLCRTVGGEAGLFDELYRAMKKNSCQYRLLNFEKTSTQAHTHISTVDCSSDLNDVRNRARPVYP